MAEVEDEDEEKTMANVCVKLSWTDGKHVELGECKRSANLLFYFFTQNRTAGVKWNENIGGTLPRRQKKNPPPVLIAQ